MYCLASTADEYLSPSLEAIAEKFQMSESIAGVTLLALGNGAPDVFAAISAGGTTDAEVNLQISSLYGSVFYIATVVVMVTLRATDGKIRVTKSYFLRDTIFILLTALYTLFIVFVSGGFNLSISIGYLVLYIVYVIVVVV